MGLPYQPGMCSCNVTFLDEPLAEERGRQPRVWVILGNRHCKWMLCLLLQVKLVVESCFSFLFAPVDEQSQWAGPGGGCGEGVLVVLVGQSREHQKPKTDCRTGTDHCRYLEFSQAEISLLGLNCKMEMNWYHVTTLVFGAGGPRGWWCFHCGWWHQGNLVLVSCPWQGVEMGFKVPPNPKHSIIPWLSCLRLGVCWRFYAFPYCVTRVEFSRCLWWWLSKLQSKCPRALSSWCPVLPALHNGRNWVLSDLKEQRLGFAGACVSGLILVYNNVKIQPSVPCVPLENVNAFRLQRIWGAVVVQKLSCALQGGLDSMGQSQVVFRAPSLWVSLVSLPNI